MKPDGCGDVEWASLGRQTGSRERRRKSETHVGTLMAALMGITKSGAGGILTLPQQGDTDISQLTPAARRNYQNRVGNINQISKGTMMSFISIL